MATTLMIENCHMIPFDTHHLNFEMDDQEPDYHALFCPEMRVQREDKTAQTLATTHESTLQFDEGRPLGCASGRVGNVYEEGADPLEPLCFEECTDEYNHSALGDLATQLLSFTDLFPNPQEKASSSTRTLREFIGSSAEQEDIIGTIGDASDYGSMQDPAPVSSTRSNLNGLIGFANCLEIEAAARKPPLLDIGKDRPRSSRASKNTNIAQRTTALRAVAVKRPSVEPNASTTGRGDDDRLPEDFAPSAIDVICGDRGKDATTHFGNIKFRTAINKHLHEYATAPTKLDKTLLVHSIQDSFRSAGSKFVRRNRTTGRWVDIGDRQVREKIGYAIRDTLNARANKKTDQKRRLAKKMELSLRKRPPKRCNH